MRTEDLPHYPNPASNIITLQTNLNESKEYEIYIFTINEQFILQNNMYSKNGFINLDIAALCNGIYFIKVVDKSNSSVATKMFFKQNY